MFGRKGLKAKTTPPLDAIPQSPAAMPAHAGTPETLLAGVTYLACISPGTPFYVEALHSLKPSTGPSNQPGLCGVFEASDGRVGKAYLFADIAFVWVAGEAGPRAQIPTNMIDDRVRDYRRALSGAIADARGAAHS